MVNRYNISSSVLKCSLQKDATVKTAIYQTTLPLQPSPYILVIVYMHQGYSKASLAQRFAIGYMKHANDKIKCSKG